MFASRSARRRGILYAVLLSTGLLMLALSGTAPMKELQRGLGFAFAPIQGALSGVTRGVTSVFGAVVEIDQLRRENKALRQRNDALEVENRQYEEIKVQNEQLTRLLDVKSTLDYETVAGIVISRQFSQYERVITLDKGSDDGVQEGNVVVAEGAALVGRVVDAGRNYSRVLLISDTTSTVIGLVQSSRATGNVVGQLGGVLVMSDIASTERVNLDDLVVTAGIDLGNGVRSPFPKGLPIGRIVDVQRDPNAVVQTAYISPAADLDKLEYVLVVIDYTGGIGTEGLPSSSPSGEPGDGESPAPTEGLTEPTIGPAP